MFELRRIVNERMPDQPSCLPIYCVYFDPVFSETFQSEEEAERQQRLLQNEGDESRYSILPS